MVMLVIWDAIMTYPLWRHRNETHWRRDKMADKCIFWNETVWISIKMELKSVPMNQFDIKSALF